jgi:hypothetical protein
LFTLLMILLPPSRIWNLLIRSSVDMRMKAGSPKTPTVWIDDPELVKESETSGMSYGVLSDARMI